MQCKHAPCTCLVPEGGHCSPECRSKLSSAQASCGCAHPDCGASAQSDSSFELQPRRVVSPIR